MPFDVTAEIEKLKAKDAGDLAKAEVLDRLLILNRPFDEFKQFVDAFPKEANLIFNKLVFVDRLFTAEMMTALKTGILSTFMKCFPGRIIISPCAARHK